MDNINASSKLSKRKKNKIND